MEWLNLYLSECDAVYMKLPHEYSDLFVWSIIIAILLIYTTIILFIIWR